MERVSVRNGDLPIILVAPHGSDDKNTDYLVDKIAYEMDTFAVINRGWKRSENFDYYADRADCNNVHHVHEDVVREEFLDPIFRMTSRILKNIDNRVYIFYIHGCSNDVRIKANDQNLDLILGYGEGTPASYTCDLRIKDAFAYFLESESFGVYEGKKKSKYAGRSRNNMNQLYKMWYPNNKVHSIQIEIVKELREGEEMIQITSDGLIGAMDSLLMFDDTLSTIKRTARFI
jgi:hypothetical protein